jgi:hypothetical protein
VIAIELERRAGFAMSLSLRAGCRIALLQLASVQAEGVKA